MIKATMKTRKLNKTHLRVNCYNFSAAATNHQDSFQSFCEHLQELHVWISRFIMSFLFVLLSFCYCYLSFCYWASVSTSKNSMSEYQVFYSCYWVTFEENVTLYQVEMLWKIINWKVFNCQRILTSAFVPLDEIWTSNIKF